MSPLPENMRDRWHNRPEPKHGHGTVYWHVLFGDQAPVRNLADAAQNALSQFSGLHKTPLRWLHMTTTLIGSSGDISTQAMDDLVAEASQRLAPIQPVKVRMERVLYHPEAIMLAVEPRFVLQPIRDGIRSATEAVLGHSGFAEQFWTPHITLCYSTSNQPAAPLIAALGRELPAAEATVSAVNLVVQQGPEHLWDWHPYAAVQLGTEVAAAHP